MRSLFLSCVLISSKIKKKKKKLSRSSNLGPFLEVVVGKKKERKEKKTLQRITQVFHFQYVGDFGITINMETKPKWLSNLESIFFIALCYYQIIPGKNWYFWWTIQCSTFNHDLREQTKTGEVISIIHLRMYQDGDSS